MHLRQHLAGRQGRQGRQGRHRWRDGDVESIRWAVETDVIYRTLHHPSRSELPRHGYVVVVGAVVLGSEGTTEFDLEVAHTRPAVRVAFRAYFRCGRHSESKITWLHAYCHDGGVGEATRGDGHRVKTMRAGAVVGDPRYRRGRQGVTRGGKERHDANGDDQRKR